MPSHREASAVSPWETIFAAAAGIWLALALTKFGNPVILDQRIAVPSNLHELLLGPWPVAWGYGLFVIVAVLSARTWRFRTLIPAWLLLTPLVWFAWQVLSATQTVDRTLTLATLKHFSVCVGAFYVGLFAFSQVAKPRVFWLALTGGFCVVLLTGWRQHFGGLAETREFFYSLPDWKSQPPELLKKIGSDRIYGTLFYPNAFAGAILLLLPPCLEQIWKAGWPKPGRLAAVGGLAVLAVVCLLWSGSKAGWLIAIVLGAIGLLHLNLDRRLKTLVVAVMILGGLAGFWLKYQGYFNRGASSVSARFDYWDVAWTTLKAEPLLGTGPGTFFVTYRKLKRPEAEMTRLAHNDYLQQGSDSGWVGMLAFIAWFWGALAFLYRRKLMGQGFALGIWLGLIGIALQSTVEFGLYIPGLAWPATFLMGTILGRPLALEGNPIDKGRRPS